MIPLFILVFVGAVATLTYANLAEKDLIIRAKQGDKNAFDELFKRHAKKVRRIAFGIIGESDADDVVADTLLRAYQSLKTFRGDASFSTWLCRMAINTALLSLRKRSTMPATVSLHGPEGGLIDYDADLGEQGSDPFEILARSEVDDTILKALEQLPDNFRSTLLLREVEGLEYEEIAYTLGCNIGTVRSRLSRARESMRQILTKLGFPQAVVHPGRAHLNF